MRTITFEVETKEAYVDYDDPLTTNYSLYIMDGDKKVGRVFLHKYAWRTYWIAYDIDIEYWNQGIMTEAVKKVLSLLPTGTLVITWVTVGNVASERVLEKNGFTKKRSPYVNNYWEIIT